MRKNWICGSLTVAAFAGMMSPAAADSVVTDWNEFATEEIVRLINPGPPAAARFYAVLNSSIYDAWAAYDPVALGTCTGNSIDRPVREATPAAKAEAVSYAAHATLLNLAPEHKDLIDEFLMSQGYALDSTTQPALTGRAAANAVMGFHANDCSNQTGKYRDTSAYFPQDPSENPASFQLVNIPGVISQNEAAQPHWVDVWPFALKSASQFRPGPPPAYGGAVWHAQIEEIIEYGATLTDLEKVIADYWKMEGGGSRTPPGHLLMLSAWKSSQLGYGLDDDVWMFFVASQAMSDAGIACWETKYYYDYVRPITAIRALGDREIQGWLGPGLGIGTMPASEFLPYQPLDFISPPFPEYGSGHATFTAAWAVAMEMTTGSDQFGYSETFTTHPIDNHEPIEPPVTLTYDDYYSAAFDSAISRLYGGVHWRVGMDVGLESGTEIGLIVHERALDFLDGSAATPYMYATNLRSDHWMPASAPDSGLAAPTFLAEDGPANIGLQIEAGGERPAFGFWQTPVLDPLAKGTYRLTVNFDLLERTDGTRRPEIRVRVLNADNSIAKMAVLAEANLDQTAADSVDIYFDSTGESAFRVAFDILAAEPDQAGGYRIDSATITKVLVRPMVR